MPDWTVVLALVLLPLGVTLVCFLKPIADALQGKGNAVSVARRNLTWAALLGGGLLCVVAATVLLFLSVR
ncbi:MAG TPA: hypothetical protein VFH47_01735 [Candidatus Thermoplasmatota archaeon]|nr:hypothetical protein [Candidatus Thermoplasmatota archaeon]